MDRLDLAIFREMFRDNAFQMAGVDPKRSAVEIADRLNIGRSTVHARWQGWEREGFLRGFAVVPNLALFGVATAGRNLRVADARAKPLVLRDMALVDGMLFAFVNAGLWMSTGFVRDNASATARRGELLARLPGVVEAEPVFPGPPMACDLEPTRLDWRLIAALRAEPEANLGAIASGLGVGLKTVTRHYDRLLKADAVWYQPRFDFARFPGAVVQFIVTLEDARQQRDALQFLRKRFPDLIAYGGKQPDYPMPVVQFVVHFESAGAVDEATAIAWEAPGARDVEMVYPLRIEMFPAWLDERIAEAIAKAAR